MKLGIFMGSRAVDGKEMYKDLGLTYSKGKSRGGGSGESFSAHRAGKKQTKKQTILQCHGGYPDH